MVTLSTDDGACVETAVEGDETALVPDGQPQQVAVSDLAVAQQLSEVDVARVQQAVVVSNEGVPWVCRGLSEPLCNGW
jgi:hypothetical protein